MLPRQYYLSLWFLLVLFSQSTFAIHNNPPNRWQSDSPSWYESFSPGFLDSWSRIQLGEYEFVEPNGFKCTDVKKDEQVVFCENGNEEKILISIDPYEFLMNLSIPVDKNAQVQAFNFLSGRFYRMTWSQEPDKPQVRRVYGGIYALDENGGVINLPEITMVVVTRTERNLNYFWQFLQGITVAQE